VERRTRRWAEGAHSLGHVSATAATSVELRSVEGKEKEEGGMSKEEERRKGRRKKENADNNNNRANAVL
jgi:hypothetical protein